MFATPPLHARFGKIIHDIVHIILCPLVVEDAQYEHRNSAVTERYIPKRPTTIAMSNDVQSSLFHVVKQ